MLMVMRDPKLLLDPKLLIVGQECLIVGVDLVALPQDQGKP